MDLNHVLRHAVAAGASNVHLKVGQPPVLRTDGALAPAADFSALGDAELQAVLDQVTVSVPRRSATTTFRAYIVNDFDMDNNTTVWGPVITRSTTISKSALINARPFPIEWMFGLPGATQTVTEVNPVHESYAG